MNRAELHNDVQEAVTVAIEGKLAETWTALPGIIESYDPAAQRAVVRLAMLGEFTAPEGYKIYEERPLLPDVPVEFPSGGGFTLTFPVKPGDECVVEFQARDVSSWKQTGGVRPPLSARMHDLTDAICRVGVRSRKNLLAPPPDAASVELRSDDGEAKMSVGPEKNLEMKNSLASLFIDPMGNITLRGMNITIIATGVFSASSTGGANIASSGPVLVQGAAVNVNV